MIDLIVRDHGEAALARLAAAYRDGASDAEALEAATGMPADELYARFFAEFDVDPPQPIRPEPIPASNVERPDPGIVDRGGVDPGAASEPPGDPGPVEGPVPADGTGVLVVLVVAGALALGVAFAVARRARSGPA